MNGFFSVNPPTPWPNWQAPVRSTRKRFRAGVRRGFSGTVSPHTNTRKANRARSSLLFSTTQAIQGTLYLGTSHPADRRPCHVLSELQHGAVPVMSLLACLFALPRVCALLPS